MKDTTEPIGIESIENRQSNQTGQPAPVTVEGTDPPPTGTATSPSEPPSKTPQANDPHSINPPEIKDVLDGFSNSFTIILAIIAIMFVILNNTKLLLILFLIVSTIISAFAFLFWWIYRLTKTKPAKWALRGGYLFGVIGLLLFGKLLLFQSPIPNPTPMVTIPWSTTTISPTYSSVPSPSDAPVITYTPTPTPTATDTTTPSPTSTATLTPTATFTPTLSPTAFPHNCFEVGIWDFNSGYYGPLPTPAVSEPECYNADGWDFYASDGILIRRESLESELRGVRLTLPNGDFFLQARITIDELRRTQPESTIDLIVGLGRYPEDDNNRDLNEWFYIIRNWGGDCLSQCVLFDSEDTCGSRDAVDALPNLPLITEDYPLRVHLDIEVTNRQVQAFAHYVNSNGSTESYEISGLDPLKMERPRWLWVGYRISSGGIIRATIELFSPIFLAAP